MKHEVVKAEERTIGQVLTDQLRYEIPAYQRPYSWNVEHTQDLLQDIEEAYDEKEQEYFVGSLITIERRVNSLYEVVDGQQRLTTLNLIFARLRENIDNADAKQEVGKRILPRNPLTGETEVPRLTLRKHDQRFFRDHVLEATPFNRDKIDEVDEPKAHMLRNMDAIDVFFRNRSQEWLKRYADFILQHVYVVLVKTESFQSAYRLFNVLNARGLRLSNADLIKNQLFSKLGEGSPHSSELEDLWVELEDTADIENLDLFLGYHRTALIADKGRKSLAEEFESIIVRDSGSPIDFVKTLISSARNYEKIEGSSFEGVQSKRYLSSLKRVTFDEWIPPLLSFLNKSVDGLSEDEFLGLLEKITMQGWIRRLSQGRRNTIYFRIIAAINLSKVASEIREIFKMGADNDELSTLLQGDIYGTSSCRAILLRLDEDMQDESVTKEYHGGLTIEHVLPQKLKDDYWKDRFSTATHLKWLHKLGNITLLCGKKNTKAQYYSFPKKKKIYLERNKKVSFDITKEICDEAEWTSDKIEERQQRLLTVALNLWQIK